MSFLLGSGLGPCVDEGPENEIDGKESCIVGWMVEGLEFCSELGVVSGVAEGSMSEIDGFTVGRLEGFELGDVGWLVNDTVVEAVGR